MCPILHFKQYLTSSRSQAAYPHIITIAGLPDSFIIQTGKVASKFFWLGGEAVIGVCHNLDLLSCKACWDPGSWSVRRQETFSGMRSLEKGMRTDSRKWKGEGGFDEIASPLLCHSCVISALLLLEKSTAYVHGMLMEHLWTTSQHHEPRMEKDRCRS